MFFTVSALTFGISYFISSIFNNVLYLFLSFFAAAILNVEILSLFKKITPEWLLILTGAEFLGALIFWLKKGRPALKFGFKNFFNNLKQAFREDKSLLVLGAFWVFLILISLILAGASPVNEPDAQGYHALRALFWARDGFISHFEVADVRCHCMPINSELFYTWVLVLFKNDCCFGLLQFFSYFLLIVSSFKIMEHFGVEFKRRLWGILIFSSFAGVISQISSTQTDLTVGALLSSSLCLILKRKSNADLFFSSLAMALAFGVKSTGVIGSVPLIIYYIFILKKDFVKFFLFLVFNALVFSSYNYVLNYVGYGNVLGSASAISGHGFWGGIKGGVGNFIRYIFQFLDFSGFTIGFYLNPHLLALQDKALAFFGVPKGLGENVGLNFTNISMTEQVLGFGILGFLVFLPGSVIGFFNKRLRIFSFLFWGEILVLSFSIAYMIYSIRFIVAFVALTIPLISLTYFKKMNLYKFIVVLFALFYMGYASLFLSQRPMFHLYKELKNSSIKTVQDNMRDLNYKFYPSFNEAYTMKKGVLPYCRGGNKIGIFASNGYMLYSTKYLELNNNCKIDTLNGLHLRDYDLQSYNVIITQKGVPQKIEAINKNDIKNPIRPGFDTICRFEGLDKSRNPRLLGDDEIGEALGARCVINDLYLNQTGFIKEGEIEAEIPKYLEGRENETVKDFIIWKRAE